MKLTSQIRSDVPFLKGETTHVYCREEEVNPIKLDVVYYILIVLPQTNISTFEAYKSLRMHLTRNDNDFKFTGSNLSKFGVWSFKEILYNDFDDSVFKRYPNLLEIKNLLYKEQAEFASLSGSGSALFGIYTVLEQVQNAYEKLSKYYSCVIAKPVY